MKKATLRCLFAVIFVGLSACEKDPANGKILINFINKTGLDIQRARAGGTLLGDMTAQSETGFVEFEEFTVDGGSPVTYFEGLVGTDTVSTPTYDCGTGFRPLKPGKYNIEVSHFKFGNEQGFGLEFKSR
jgi:hypothetical protein